LAAARLIIRCLLLKTGEFNLKKEEDTTLDLDKVVEMIWSMTYTTTL
jgi:hypothetical protein